MFVRIKICCISSEHEAACAIAAGASALGLVSAMPSGPGVIDEARIAEIVATVPRGIDTFLLTSARDVDTIVAQHRRCRTTTIQLVNHVSGDVHAELRSRLPDVTLVQVVHVQDLQSVAYAQSIAPAVDALLLDSGQPNASIQTLGGTGRVHDWTLSRRIVDHVAIPVYLAGGLNAHNVSDAITTVRPFGVDLCSGVRTDGALDPDKLHAFVHAVVTQEAGVMMHTPP